MKFAMRDHRLLEALNTDYNTGWIVAAFFFHDRGSEVQKSLTGMFQEILCSILQQIPALVVFVVPCYNELVKIQRTRTPTWTSDVLQSAMLSITKQRKVQIRILLFLDALDEHDGDNDMLAMVLKSFVKSADNDCVRLKLCLASRSWTVFGHHFGMCPGFAIHEYTKQDIRTYIEARLDINRQMLRSISGQTGLVRLADLVAERALGVFIWVRLVVDLLSKGIRDGTPYVALEDQVAKMPRELKDLYANTLRRVDPGYSTEAYIMLQMALCSLVPLPARSFMASLDFVQRSYRWPRSDDARLKDPTTLGIYDFENGAPRSWNMSRLASRSGGLLELSPAASELGTPEAKMDLEDGNAKPVVQFIHQTVKEYVQMSRRELGLVGVDPQIIGEDGNMFLIRACAAQNTWVSCIKKDVFSYAQRAMASFQFRRIDEPAYLNAGLISGLMQDALPEQGPFNLDWFLSQHKGSFFEALRQLIVEDMSPSQSQQSKGRRNAHRNAFEKLTIAMDLPEFLKEDTLKDSVGLLHVAAAGDLVNRKLSSEDPGKTIKYLVANRSLLDESSSWLLGSISTSLPVDHDFRVTALSVALLDDNENEETRLMKVKVLLEAGADPDIPITLSLEGMSSENLNSQKFTISPLDLCVCLRSGAIVRLLLQHWADVSTRIGGWTTYSLAATRGDLAVLQALKDFGITQSEFLSREIGSINDMAVLPGLAATVLAGSPTIDLLGRYFGWDFNVLDAVGITHHGMT